MGQGRVRVSGHDAASFGEELRGDTAPAGGIFWLRTRKEQDHGAWRDPLRFQTQPANGRSYCGPAAGQTPQLRHRRRFAETLAGQ